MDDVWVTVRSTARPKPWVLTHVTSYEFLRSKTHSFQRLEVLRGTFVFFPTVTPLAFVVILIPSLHQVLTVGSPLI